MFVRVCQIQNAHLGATSLYPALNQLAGAEVEVLWEDVLISSDDHLSSRLIR